MLSWNAKANRVGKCDERNHIDRKKRKVYAMYDVKSVPECRYKRESSRGLWRGFVSHRMDDHRNAASAPRAASVP